METYTYNRACSCLRCKAQGLMGAAILITLGVLFLLSELHVLYFRQGFPLLLIVIGVVLYLSRSAPIEGHIEPYRAQPPRIPQTPAAPAPPADSQQGPEVNR